MLQDTIFGSTWPSVYWRPDLQHRLLVLAGTAILEIDATLLTVSPLGECRYMDAPGMPSFQFVLALRYRLHQYIRTLFAAKPLSLMGFAGWCPTGLAHLMVLRHSRALPTTV